jgi:hypothetical protein
MKSHVLDIVLRHIYYEKEGVGYAQVIVQYLQDIGLEGKGVPSYEKVNIDMTIRYLEDRRIIYHSPKDQKYYITVEGVVFYEKPNRTFIDRPFAYERWTNRLNASWKVIKILAAGINALAIIYLTYLQIRSNK